MARQQAQQSPEVQQFFGGQGGRVDWGSLFQVVLPIIIRLLQGLATLPPDAQNHVAQHLTMNEMELLQSMASMEGGLQHGQQMGGFASQGDDTLNAGVGSET